MKTVTFYVDTKADKFRDWLDNWRLSDQSIIETTVGFIHPLPVTIIPPRWPGRSIFKVEAHYQNDDNRFTLMNFELITPPGPNGRTKITVELFMLDPIASKFLNRLITQLRMAMPSLVVEGETGNENPPPDQSKLLEPPSVEDYPFLNHIWPKVNQSFKVAWAGLDDRACKDWESLVKLSVSHQADHQIARKLNVSLEQVRNMRNILLGERAKKYMKNLFIDFSQP